MSTKKKDRLVKEASEILKRLQEQQKKSSAAKTRAIPHTKLADLENSSSIPTSTTKPSASSKAKPSRIKKAPEASVNKLIPTKLSNQVKFESATNKPQTNNVKDAPKAKLKAEAVTNSAKVANKVTVNLKQEKTGSEENINCEPTKSISSTIDFTLDSQLPPLQSENQNYTNQPEHSSTQNLGDLEQQVRQVISQELHLISQELNLGLWQEFESGFETKGLTKEIANLLIQLGEQLSLPEVLALNELDHEVINYLQLNEVEQQILAFNLLSDALQKELSNLKLAELNILNLDQAFAELFEKSYLLSKTRNTDFYLVPAIQLTLEQLLRYSIYGDISSNGDISSTSSLHQNSVNASSHSEIAIQANNAKQVSKINPLTDSKLTDAYSSPQANSELSIDFSEIPNDILLDFMLGNRDDLFTAVQPDSDSLPNSALSNTSKQTSESEPVVATKVAVTASAESQINNAPLTQTGQPQITITEYSATTPAHLTVATENQEANLVVEADLATDSNLEISATQQDRLGVDIAEIVENAFASSLALYQEQNDSTPSALQHLLQTEAAEDPQQLVTRLLSQLADPNPVKTQLPNFAETAQFNRWIKATENSANLNSAELNLADLCQQAIEPGVLLENYDLQRVSFLQEYSDKVPGSAIRNGLLQVDYDQHERLYLQHSAETIKFFRSPSSNGIPNLTLTGYQALSPYQVVSADMIFIPDLANLWQNQETEIDLSVEELTKLTQKLLASNAILNFNYQQLTATEIEKLLQPSLVSRNRVWQKSEDTAEAELSLESLLTEYYQAYIQQPQKLLAASPSASKKAILTYQAWLQESPLATITEFLTKITPELHSESQSNSSERLKSFWLAISATKLEELGFTTAQQQELSHCLRDDKFQDLVEEQIFSGWKLSILQRLEHYLTPASLTSSSENLIRSLQEQVLDWLLVQEQYLQELIQAGTSKKGLDSSYFIDSENLVLADSVALADFTAFKRSLAEKWLAELELVQLENPKLIARLQELQSKISLLVKELSRDLTIDLAALISQAEFRTAWLFASLEDFAQVLNLLCTEMRTK